MEIDFATRHLQSVQLQVGTSVNVDPKILTHYSSPDLGVTVIKILGYQECIQERQNCVILHGFVDYLRFRAALRCKPVMDIKVRVSVS